MTNLINQPTVTRYFENGNEVYASDDRSIVGVSKTEAAKRFNVDRRTIGRILIRLSLEPRHCNVSGSGAVARAAVVDSHQMSQIALHLAKDGSESAADFLAASAEITISKALLASVGIYDDQPVKMSGQQAVMEVAKMHIKLQDNVADKPGLKNKIDCFSVDQIALGSADLLTTREWFAEYGIEDPSFGQCVALGKHLSTVYKQDYRDAPETKDVQKYTPKGTKHGFHKLIAYPQEFRPYVENYLIFNGLI